MDLHMYLGRVGSGKTYAAYEWIKEKLESHPGETIILLVPDAATYKAERDLASFMGGGFATVRVVGFSRLAYQVYQSLGASAKSTKALSTVGRNLLLRLVMKRCENQTEVLGSALKQAQFSDILQDLMVECKSFQVTADSLRAGAASLEDPNLQRKINELAILMDAYDQVLDSHMCDDREDMELLIEALPKSPLLEKAHVVIDGFHWFTPLQYELIYGLIERAQDALITVTLPTDPKELAHQSRPGALFSRPYEVYTTLKARYGSAMVIQTFDENKRFKSPVLKALSDDFFHMPQNPSGLGEGDRIPLIAAYNREREGDEVLRRIMALVQEGGYRYRDIMIVLRDSDSYGDILEKAFQTYEVPYFMDRQKPMNTHPLAEFLLGLFEVVRFNFNHDSIFRLLKTDLVPLGQDLNLAESRRRVDELENYCLEFGIHHYKWDMEIWPWFRKGKDGKPCSELEEERFASVNESHRIIMSWLGDWFDFAAHPEGHRAREWAEALYDLIERLELPKVLYTWAQEADQAGQQVVKVSHEQIYRQAMNLLDQVASVGGDEILTKDEMALLVEEGLEDINYSMVPPSLDHVLVTTVERGYTQERKHVFVMGLNDGVFPRKMGTEGLIKDKERNALAQVGIQLAGGALVQAFNENFLFYLACSRAQDSLTLSFANTSGEGESLEASLVIKRLQDLAYVGLPGKVDLHIPSSCNQGFCDYDSLVEFSYMWRPMQALSLLSSRWGDLLEGQGLTSPWWSLYEWALDNKQYRPRLIEVMRGLFDSNQLGPDKKPVGLLEPAVVTGLFLPHQYMTGSVTRLEKYQECPFKFYSEYGLKLKPRKVASYGAPEIGTLLHEHLKVLGEGLLKEGKQWSDLSPEEQHKRCQAVAAHVMDQSLLGYADMDADQEEDNQDQESPHSASDMAYNKARYDRLVGTLEATVARLADWSFKSQFSMTELEKSFGMHEEWPSVDVPLGKGRLLKLQGQIDRIDTWQDGHARYGLIMDYKTGSAGISGGELYYGLKLQLLTYWMAYKHVAGHEDVLPAGTIYTPVKSGKLSFNRPISREEAADQAVHASEFKSFGYFTDSPDLLMKMDDLAANNKAGLYVPIRISSKGINGQDKWRTKSLGDYDIMSRYVTHKMAQIGQGIVDGKFPIAPYRYKNKQACTYCDYKTICRFESKRNRYHNLPGLREDEALNKMREDLGIRVSEGGEANGD